MRLEVFKPIRETYVWANMKSFLADTQTKLENGKVKNCDAVTSFVADLHGLLNTVTLKNRTNATLEQKIETALYQWYAFQNLYKLNHCFDDGSCIRREPAFPRLIPMYHIELERGGIMYDLRITDQQVLSMLLHEIDLDSKLTKLDLRNKKHIELIHSVMTDIEKRQAQTRKAA